MSRYEGKPLLRILECYALDAIGHLTAQEQDALQRMEPKLASLFGKTGNWKEIIEAELSLEASTPEQIRVIWEENVRRAKESNEELPPEHFAQMFVDENFQA